jgi:hypothetical protein
MLVYYYLELGYSSIGGKRVWGSALGRPPTRISYKEYLDNKDIVTLAPLMPSYIESIVGRPFPLKMSFTIETLKFLKEDKLKILADYFQIPTKSLNTTKIIYALRKATREM